MPRKKTSNPLPTSPEPTPEPTSEPISEPTFSTPQIGQGTAGETAPIETPAVAAKPARSRRKIATAAADKPAAPPENAKRVSPREPKAAGAQSRRTKKGAPTEPAELADPVTQLESIAASELVVSADPIPEFESIAPPEPTASAEGATPGKAVAEPETITATEPTHAKAKPRRVKKTSPAATAEPVDSAMLDLPVPEWRPAQRAGVPPSAEVASEEEGSEFDLAETGDEASPAADAPRDGGRRRRRRRGRGDGGAPRQPAEQGVAEAMQAEPAPMVSEKVAARPAPAARAPRPQREAATVAEPLAPAAERETYIRPGRPPVQMPGKAAIAVPADAPQIVVRDGVPTLVRDHRVYPPIMFFGSPADERRAKTVFEEVKMAADAGVHLHSYLIDFDVDEDRVDQAAKFAAYVLAHSIQVDPESQVVFRMVIQAPRNWTDRYPDAAYKNVDGTLAEPSVCDDAFWGVAKTCLERFIRQMRLLEQSKHILGIHLERGEWFFAEGAGYDDSRAANVKFREWARTRYRNDEVTLRASWFDGSARFETIRVPEYRPEGDEGERFIRASRRQRRYVDYHLFLSDATVQRIADLAYAAKEASDGYYLIGASYGYTFEWSHPSSGHLSLGKLLRTPEIDFIAGPPSYRSRQPGGAGAFPGPIDSFALNGKLYISEEDFKTSLSDGHEPDDFNPQLKTPQALESVHWRGVGAALAHASGVAWMDLWGNGWLRTHSVWERAKKVREAMVDRAAAPLDDPEVAVFIDERALAYLVDSNAFKLLVQNVRESVLRAGVSAAFYLLSDLAHREKFPESKLYLFVNAWDVRPELRSAIKSRLQRDNKVLFWLYSAGLFDAGRDSLERAREVTGIALKPQPFNSRSGTTILNRRHPLSEAFPERNLIGGSKLEPSYFAIPEGATVLGEYSQTGLPSFVVKEFREGPAETHWTSVFLGEPQVNPALIRALAQLAGAHVWNFHEDVVHVRHPFCTIHCQGAGPRTITLPGKFSAYNLLTDEWGAVDSPNFRFHALDGMTYCYLVGPRAELEHQLHADPRIVLHIDNLPPRDANVRIDSSNFDVPIMKLDEWMGEADSDDNADEWFLRPHQIDEEPPAPAEESPERVGRRRRRRRGRGGSDGGSNDAGGGRAREAFGFADPAGGASEFDDIGMNVLFRKRE